MSDTLEQIIEERRRLKDQYGQLFDLLVALLFRHDPVGINLDTNVDEYDPEVRTILPRLSSCHTVDDVQQVVYDEFVRWFDTDVAGPRERYTLISSEIWNLWKKYCPN